MSVLQLTQRPLTASTLDGELFVGRERELAAIHRSLRLGFNVLVLGEPGSGRSSLLRRVQHAVEADAGGTVWVPGQPWPERIDIVEAIDDELGNRNEPRVRRKTPFGKESQVAGLEHVMTELADDRIAFGRPGANGQFTVLIDDADADVAYALFGRFRDVVWESPARWVVSGSLKRRDRYLAPPADAFFDTVIQLSELDPEDAAELLRRRTTAAGPNDPDARRLESAIPKLVNGLSQRTPRMILAGARRALMAEEPADAAAQQDLALLSAERVGGRSAAALMSELIEHGPTYAGDPDLLDRLALTRNRVVRLLKDLEAAGLVTATRAGRRVIYSPCEADNPR